MKFDYQTPPIILFLSPCSCQLIANTLCRFLLFYLLRFRICVFWLFLHQLITSESSLLSYVTLCLVGKLPLRWDVFVSAKTKVRVINNLPPTALTSCQQQEKHNWPLRRPVNAGTVNKSEASSESASGFPVQLWPHPRTSNTWTESSHGTFLDSTKWVATPALCTSRPLSRKPVKARNNPNFPWSLGRK